MNQFQPKALHSENITKTNSSGIYDEEQQQIPIINAAVICISCIAICFHIFALAIISRCQKIPLAIRYLSRNLLACFIALEFAISQPSLMMLLCGNKFYRLIFDIRIFFGCSLVSVMWCSLCGITLERLLVLTMPFHYNKYVTKKILAIFIGSIWTINVMIPVVVFIVTAIQACGQHDYHYITACDIYAIFRPTRMVLLSFLVLYAIFIVTAYTKILSIVFHHHKQIDSLELTANKTYLSYLEKREKYLKSTKTVLAIILTFIVFQSPLFFHLVIFEWKPELHEHKWRMILQGVDYLGHQLNTYACLYLYIWKFKECRMHLFLMLSKWNKNFLTRATSLRIEVFDIVIKEKCSSK